MLHSDAHIYYLLFATLFLIGAMCLSGFKVSIQHLGRFQSKEFFHHNHYRFHFFHFFLKKFYAKQLWSHLFSFIALSKMLLLSGYISCSMIWIIGYFPKLTASNGLITVLLLIAFTLLVDYMIRFIAIKFTSYILATFSVITSFFLTLLTPITAPLVKILDYFASKDEKQLIKHKFASKEKVLDLLRELELSKYLDNYDQKIIASFITFREKVAREIMVPRINLSTLPVAATVMQAAQEFVKEGYSRIPIYKETLDNILGVLMYKDVMECFTQSIEKKDPSLLNQTVLSIIKPAIYAPENKKISYLFQEFRNKQSHMAIVVNEYGGTEGLVTIEDILEELVGEIEDEYDIGAEDQYWKMANGSWIVDAKMSIIDLENNLGVTIPHNPEYETIGGYVFHRAGTIPSKGWKIHLDKYELEVLISNERCIEKIRITPTQPNTN